MARDRLGQDRFVRGMPEATGTARTRGVHRQPSELLQAYARVRTRDDFRPYAMDRDEVLTLEQALDRLRPIVGDLADWTDLMAFLPEGWEADPKAPPHRHGGQFRRGAGTGEGGQGRAAPVRDLRADPVETER
jgi:segregation and condensation protein A